MTGRVREVEIASPLMWKDITALCHISRNGLVAECFSCGFVMRGNVHLCEVAYGGFFCSRCCPTCSGRVTLTPAEMEAIERNAQRHRSMGGHETEMEEQDGAGVLEEVKPPGGKPFDRSRMMRAQWQQPAYRRQMTRAMNRTHPLPESALRYTGDVRY